jgi:hypothetical protein
MMQRPAIRCRTLLRFSKFIAKAGPDCVRPRTLKECWKTRADRGLAMQIYFEIVAIHLLGLLVLASIAALCVFLYQ